MFGDDWNDQNFEETVRSIAREAGRSLERMMESVDLDEAADAIGVDPDTARDWVQSASSWLRARAENLGDEMAGRVAGFSRTAGGSHRAATGEETLLGAVPHPLDVPTDEQGLALAALSSGRWTVEPGTEALSAKGDGPGPSDALGIVRELRVRDWIAADGEVTLVGRRALTRWLQAATPH